MTIPLSRPGEVPPLLLPRLNRASRQERTQMAFAFAQYLLEFRGNKTPHDAAEQAVEMVRTICDAFDEKEPSK